jgi:hypothetical protein
METKYTVSAFPVEKTTSGSPFVAMTPAFPLMDTGTHVGLTLFFTPEIAQAVGEQLIQAALVAKGTPAPVPAEEPIT